MCQEKKKKLYQCRRAIIDSESIGNWLDSTSISRVPVKVKSEIRYVVRRSRLVNVHRHGREVEGRVRTKDFHAVEKVFPRWICKTGALSMSEYDVRCAVSRGRVIGGIGVKLLTRTFTMEDDADNEQSE